MLNRVTLVGELVCHPFRSSDRGRPCVRLRLCPQGTWVDPTGQPQPRGAVLPVFVFEDAARGLDLLQVGSRIAVKGRLRAIEPETRAGPPVSVLGVEALEIDFLRLGRGREPP